jgi:PD-(D/E)XK endonuclease
MTNKGIDIRHPKLRGEWAELRFMARAAEHGLRVSKPFGDCASYDVTVEHAGKFLRVQVKSTKSSKKGSQSYVCDLRRRGSQPYTQDRVDFFAVYVIPCDVWYIFPAEVAIASQANLTLSPDLPGSKHAPYREAWHLLTGGTASQPSAAQQQEEDSPDDEPMNPVEARFRAIQWNPILPPHWKPRR